MAAFQNLLTAVVTAIVRQDGPAYRRLLDPRNPETVAAVREASEGGFGGGSGAFGGHQQQRWNPAPAVSSALAAARASSFASVDEWRDAVSSRLSSVAASIAGRPREAFEALGDEVAPFLKLFRDDQEAWMVEPLVGLGRALRRAAVEADKQAPSSSAAVAAAAAATASAAGMTTTAKAAAAAAAATATTPSSGGGGGSKALETCGTHLQKCFAAAQQAAGGNKKKKLASLDLVVSLFRVYFALNTLRLCKNLIAAVSSRQFAPFESFPASQRVTYKYFCGRLAIFDEAYADADAHLSYALSRCPPGPGGDKQRARAAFYLVPVRLLVGGSLPSRALLASSREVKESYEALAAAVRAGDLRALDAALDERRWEYVQAGTYLLLEKLRPAVARRIVRKVAAIHAAPVVGGPGAAPGAAHQLPLAKVAAALEWSGCASDRDAVECLLARLIHRRLVKGYIAHRAGVLVLSKAEPFPSLETVSLADPMM